MPLAFVPFVQYLAGADFIGYLVGIPAVFAEVGGIVLFLAGAAHHRGDPPPRRAGDVHVGVGSIALLW